MSEREVSLPDKQRHYSEKDDYNRYIYHKREQDVVERTISTMHDAEKLIAICDTTGDFDDTSEYQLLIRLLKEQTIFDNDGSRVSVRRKKKILQRYY